MQTCVLPDHLLIDLAAAFDAALIPYVTAGFVLGVVVCALVMFAWALRNEDDRSRGWK